MEIYFVIMVSALLMLLYGSVSKISEGFYLTGPMFFTVVGAGLSFIVDDFWSLSSHTQMIKFIAEITLIIVLFIDASEINHKHLKDGPSSVGFRLLALGLPLTALMGVAIGEVLFTELSFIVVILIALILTPTDAALGQPLIKSVKLPEHIKQNISVESGLNDGLTLPAIVICFAILTGDVGQNAETTWLIFIATQLILGPLVGASIGWFGGKFVEFAVKKGWMAPLYQSICAMSLPLLAFSCAEVIEGNGFIAAFVCGYFFGVQDHNIRLKVQEFGEAEGQQLTLFVFLLFGFVMVPFASDYWNWTALLYSVLSLTFIRMLPVFLSLIGTQLPWREQMLYAWFGPRGIASILYLLMFIALLGTQGYEYPAAVIVLTVILSIILHGISAIPLVNWYQSKTSGSNHIN